MASEQGPIILSEVLPLNCPVVFVETAGNVNGLSVGKLTHGMWAYRHMISVLPSNCQHMFLERRTVDPGNCFRYFLNLN